MNIFINGVKDTAIGTDGTAYTPSCSFMSASDSNSSCLPDGNNWNGMLDEIRISNIARSTGWILTEYNNESSPSTFYSLGSEEVY